LVDLTGTQAVGAELQYSFLETKLHISVDPGLIEEYKSDFLSLKEGKRA
jgi:hypothetical protein